MTTAAIIAEYNPLHAGHRFHFQETMRRTGADACLILMSGNFVQRGEPAISDKFTRAAQAVAMGADLVLELPFIYAVNSAEFFAAGAVRLLSASGVVNWLSFGSETADLDQLHATAERMLEPEHLPQVRQLMKQGLSYAKAVETRLGRPLKQPNDILAVQYLRALKDQASPIQPLTIKRRGSYHDDSIATDYPSASAIRQAHKDGRLNQISNPIYFEDLTDMIYGCLLRDDLSSIHGVKEGIQPALQRAALRTYRLSDLLDAIRTPRFSLARLKRLLIHCLMNYQAKDQAELQEVIYFRPLAFNTTGRRLLKVIKDRAPDCFIPTLARYQPDELTRRALAFDIQSSNIYYHLQGSGPEQARKAIYLK